MALAISVSFISFLYIYLFMRAGGRGWRLDSGAGIGGWAELRRAAPSTGAVSTGAENPVPSFAGSVSVALLWKRTHALAAGLAATCECGRAIFQLQTRHAGIRTDTRAPYLH